MLLIEDEEPIRRFLRASLEGQGYRIKEAATANEGLLQARTQRPDLILLDLGLPDADGIDVTKAVRRDSSVPIVVLTARGQEQDKVAALDAGADDYLTKPFSTQELVARIRAVLRRKTPEALEEAVAVGHLRVDPATRRVVAGGQELRLGPTEFKLLHFLVAHPDRVHSRKQLLDRVWGDHVFIEERTVDVHVKRLRDALAPARCASMIETVRGAGYRLVESAQALSTP